VLINLSYFYVDGEGGAVLAFFLGEGREELVLTLFFPVGVDDTEGAVGGEVRAAATGITAGGIT